MKKRVWNVTIHSSSMMPTDIEGVVESWWRDGLYCVRQLSGRVWRFPIEAIGLINESPHTKVKVVR